MMEVNNMADMNNMNKEYRLERMNHYAGTMVTERTYNLTIGLTLLWGVLINVVMATFFTYQILSMNYLLVLVLYFAGTIGCSILVHKSNSPAATALITVIMVLLSMLYPGFFQNLGRTLFVSLIGCILVELIGSLLFGLPMTIVDYAVALIFCGYIGLDWHRAQQFPKTLNNAVDSAADIYLDVVNLFVRILSITGKRRD